MVERQRFPKCGLCGHYHAGVAHIWDKANSPTIAEVKAATAGLERVFPSSNSNSKPARPLVGVSASNEGGASRLSAKPPKAAPPKFPRKRPVATVITSPKGVRALVHSDKKPTKPETIAALGRLIDATAEQVKKRGRKPGKVPFDKKAYDRQRAAEKRAAKKVAVDG